MHAQIHAEVPILSTYASTGLHLKKTKQQQQQQKKQTSSIRDWLRQT